MTRFRSGAATAVAVAAVMLCAVWDPGVAAAAAVGLALTAFLLLVDSAGAHGGAGRHLPALVAGAACTVLAAAALLLPAASSVLAVVAGLGALVGAFRLTYSARRR